MLIKGLIEEDFVNFYLPSMYIAFPSCSWKCGRGLCQNSPLAQSPNIDISREKICERFLSNPIAKAFVIAGLEPFDSFIELLSLVDTIRNKHQIGAPIAIYTGYTREELEEGKLFIEGNKETFKSGWEYLISLPNIIIKFGRYIPGQEPHYDSVLGVRLASNNQYAEWFNKEEELFEDY